jgi:hypothetical protein
MVRTEGNLLMYGGFMLLDPGPHHEPETSTASSAEEMELDGKAVKENDNFESSGIDQPNTQNHGPRFDVPPEVKIDYYMQEERLIDYLRKELIAEWQPTGLSEETAVTELALLYWRRKLSLERINETQQSERKDTNCGEDIEKLSPEENEKTLVARAMQVMLRSNPQESIERDQTHLDQLIRQKIDWIVYLKMSKKKD